MNSRRLKTNRSTDAPMDFQFTSRPTSNIKPVWARSANANTDNDVDDLMTPQKRPHDDIASPSPSSPSFASIAAGAQHTTMFGTNTNRPFLFNAPAPPPSSAYPWQPPSNFSPQKAFPQPQAEEVDDIDMRDANGLASPERVGKTAKDGSNGEGSGKASSSARAMAFGGLRRVFKSRQRRREQEEYSDASESVSEDESGDDEGGGGGAGVANGKRGSKKGGGRRKAMARAQSLSNHYTLNIPAPPAPASDLPSTLLGYLQFFFNLSLVLLFLYLLVQFILTVQRDVEHRITEYSLDIVQEIALCASHYKNNLCDRNPVPAMTRQCHAWETCMNRDPTAVGRARIGAEMVAEVFNGFVEPISWKTLGFSLATLAFMTIFVNALLSLYRSRGTHPHPHPTSSSPASSIPPTPHHPQHMAGYTGYLPPPPPVWSQQQHPYHLPPSPWVKEEGGSSAGAPARRRRLEGGVVEKVR